MPPTIVAMNATSTMLTPIEGETVPVRAVSRIDAAAASTPESANADATTVSARIPSTRAARKSSAAARIWVPGLIRWKKATIAASSARVTPMVIRSSFWTATSPIVNEPSSPEREAGRPGQRPPGQRGDVLKQVAERERRDQERRGRGVPDRAERHALHRHRKCDHGDEGERDQAGPGRGTSTSTYAPAMISSPWAKLIRRMIPKITAMPSANSAYRLPSAIASIASWIQGAVTSASGTGVRTPGRPNRARPWLRAPPVGPRARSGPSAGRMSGRRARPSYARSARRAAPSHRPRVSPRAR